MPAEPPPTQGMPTSPEGAGGWRLGDRYLVTGRIGAGGMAEVFRAHDEMLARDVAVKVFRAASTAADSTAGLERQRAELLALAQLNHPHLITLYDGSVGDGGENAYLVMELVEGPNLGDRIERGPLPPEAEARAIGAQVASALAYVHAAGMVHRDIKPANILLGAGSGQDEAVRARLSDFGIVRLLGTEGMTAADSTLGTASYLAPEQVRGSSVGPPADVYALGLTLLEALTGFRSFEGDSPIEAAMQRLDRDPQIPADLPSPWPGLLTAMTSRNPADRPSAEQVAATLRAGATGTTQFLTPSAGAAGAAGAAAGAAGAAAGAAGAAAGAGATDATSVIPGAAAGSSPPMPPVRRDQPVDEPPPPERRGGGGRGGRGWMLAGLALALALLAVGVIVLIATSGDSGSGGAGPTTSPSGVLTGPPTSAGRTTHRRRSTAHSTAPRTTHRAPRTTSSAPRSTSSPPTTSSAPPTTSSPPSSSSRPASTTATTSTSSTTSSAAVGAVSKTSSSTTP